MEAPCETRMMEHTEVPRADAHSDPFGILRAELLDDDVYKLFTKPAYYPELDAPRPCVLVGGRGTGKTTVLRAISHEGRHNRTGAGAETWPYIGLYHKINSNRVTAFDGEELTPETWNKAFGHYVNLLLTHQVLSFLQWYRANLDASVRLPDVASTEIAETLFVAAASSEEELAEAVRREFNSFQRFLNNLNADNLPAFSLQGQPVDEICRHILEIPGLHRRKITFIIDEFENLLDYQQIIFNTLIKHSGEFYNFAVGVKELGWRQKYTRARTEALSHPADYLLIDIGERLGGDHFEAFAREVCNLRLSRIPEDERPSSIEATLPGLSIEEEAKLLGVEEVASSILKRGDLDAMCLDELRAMEPLERYLADFWSRKGPPMNEVLGERRADPEAWRKRYHNYSVALLFELRQGKAGVAKYYAGWNVYLKLANGNIRYLLELIGEAREVHRRQGGLPNTLITPLQQTEAARSVGSKHLFALEGLSADGAKLTKLVLGLGRVFEVMAKKPLGHMPEVSQFYLQENAPLGELEHILREAIMNLALSRATSNKLSGNDLRAYDYSLHPIFAPFFEFSWRRKRKMKLSPSQLLGLISEPSRSIAQILRQKDLDSKQPLPEQLRLFESFFGDATR